MKPRSRIAVQALAALLAVGCGSREIAAVRDLDALRDALNEPAKYVSSLEQLEARPEAALLAVHEQSAPAGTRREFLLRLIGNHLERVPDFARWREARPEQLDGSEHVYFWSERLLFGSAGEGAAAAAHLAKEKEIGHEALGWRIRDTAGDADQAFRIAALALGKSNDVATLQAALEAWYSAGRTDAAAANAVSALRDGVAQLPATKRAGTEKRVLASLEKDALSRAARQARLAILAQVISPTSLERVVVLRKSEWGTDLRRDIDPVIAAAFAAPLQQALTAKTPGAAP